MEERATGRRQWRGEQAGRRAAMADQGRHTYEAIEAQLVGCIYSAAPSAAPLKEVL